MRLAAFLASCLLLCGCFEYSEEIRFNDDGSGTVRVRGWIDYEIAGKFYGGREDAQVMPPITEGVVNYLAVGSKEVDVKQVSVVPEGGKWVFDIVMDFADVDELVKTNYFRQRGIGLHFLTAKKLSFSGKAVPTAIQIARDYAEVYKDNPYSAKYHEMYGTTEFEALASAGNFTFTVAMRGANAEGNADRIDPTGKNTVEAHWEFDADDLMDPDATPRFQLTTTLPPERGFTEVVVALLLASVAGILFASIRLVILKMQGAS